jgi:hypothetical protein
MVAVVATRPRAVSLAAFFLLSTFAISLIEMGGRLSQTLPNLPAIFFYCMLVFPFAVMSGLVYLTFRRYNWARITCVSLVGVRALVALPRAISELSHSPLIGVAGLILVALELFAAYLLLSGPSNAWFKSAGP